MTRVLVGKWTVQGTLAWRTSPIQTKVWNQTFPQEDRWGNWGELQYRSNFLFNHGIWDILWTVHVYRIVVWIVLVKQWEYQKEEKERRQKVKE